ncbi:hypothetical protein [Pseudomonas sp. A34-9]|uniref:hypothetical protein n=1 Tax=Pseudomonas sp. A34-9 TaxID=3034675 RepID=UPI00240D7D6D|nr:hypothetical protein [Pseudomonas sp. A34-9]
MATTPTGQSNSPQPVAPTWLPENEEPISGVMAADNTVLTLYPPDLPEATRLEAGAHFGVPLRIYDFAPQGAAVRFGPYLGQLKGDTVLLDLNGQPGIDSTQTQAVDDTVTLHIPKKMLLADVVNRLTCTVRRGSGNMGTSEPPLELLYNKIRPGKEDTSPGDDEHSELELLLSDALRNGVGADFPAAGAQVCVSYPYCRAYDLIRLNLNGHDVYHQVTEQDAPDPGSSEPVKVCFNVTRADFEKAKDHPKFNISYTVTDQLGNGADPDSPWSAVQTIDVDLAGARLPKAFLRESLSGADESPDIDLEKLGANPLLVIVLTSDSRFLVGDDIYVTYTAKVTGKPDVVVTASGSVTKDEFDEKQRCVLTIANEKVIAGSEVTVVYTLLRGGASVGNSLVTTADVLGEGLPKLQAPQLIKSANRVLDPLDPANLQGAIGRVEVLGYRQGDTVQLVVRGKPGAGSPEFEPKALNANSRANFVLNSACIAANLGEPVDLHFVQLRGGKPVQTSPDLAASIGRIPDYHATLPTPIIGAESGADLDVNKQDAKTLLNVSAWPHQVAGQRIWIDYIGVDRDGNETVFEDLKGEAHSATQGLSRVIPFEWLSTRKDRSLVIIRTRVNYYGENDKSKAVKLPERTYTVTTVLVEDFEDQPTQRITRAGERLVTPALTFELLSTAVSPTHPTAYTQAAIDTSPPGKQLHWYVVAQEKAQITFVRPCQKLSFLSTGNMADPHFADVHFYGTGGYLGQKRISLANRGKTIEFSGRDIVRLEFLANGNIAWVFDDFVLTP